MGTKTILTPEIFFKDLIILDEPKILSRRNEDYYDYAISFTPSDVMQICSLLLNPYERIFTKNNIKWICSYHEIIINNQKYHITSYRMKDLLLLIAEKKFPQLDVLHDLSRLLSKNKPEQLKLKIKSLKHLVKKDFIKVKEIKNWKKF